MFCGIWAGITEAPRVKPTFPPTLPFAPLFPASDDGHMSDQGIHNGDIPLHKQIHPGFQVKNAESLRCSPTDEWNYLSCHQGS